MACAQCSLSFSQLWVQLKDTLPASFRKPEIDNWHQIAKVFFQYLSGTRHTHTHTLS